MLHRRGRVLGGEVVDRGVGQPPVLHVERAGGDLLGRGGQPGRGQEQQRREPGDAQDDDSGGHQSSRPARVETQHVDPSLAVDLRAR